MNDGGRLDVQVALQRSSERLHEEFGDRLDAVTVRRFLDYSYDELAGRASVTNWLPVLAERFARQRLTALARIENAGKGEREIPIVLFLCVHNAGRSQMALGFLNAIAGPGVIGWSGGSEPASRINPAAVAAMAERGIDIADEFPKPWTDEVVRAADVVITMGCGDTCPYYPGKRYEDWPVADPQGLDVDGVREIRDDIERRVHRLHAEIASASAPA